METITELTDEFADQAFTVKALNSDDAYTDYLNKLLSFTIQFVDEAQFSKLINIVEILSQKNTHEVASLIAQLYEKLIDSLIAEIQNDTSSFLNLFKLIIIYLLGELTDESIQKYVE